jgi:1,4-alpha-glucan branching enzyme
VDWWLLEAGPYHKGVQRMMEDLNRLYKEEPALFESDYDYDGFWWIDCGDAENSVLSFVRQNRDRSNQLAVILNLTPVLRSNYRLGLPREGVWKELFNSDCESYGGSNQGNLGQVVATGEPMHNQAQSASITLPPMGIVVFKPA